MVSSDGQSSKYAWWNVMAKVRNMRSSIGSARNTPPETLPLLHSKPQPSSTIASTPKSTESKEHMHRRNCCKESALVLCIILAGGLALYGAVRALRLVNVSSEICLSLALLLTECCCSVYGTTLLRLSHYRQLEIDAGLVQFESLGEWQRPKFLWWVGFSIFMGAQFFAPFVYALSSMSVVGPFTSCYVFVNLIAAYFILGEDISKRDVIATIFSMCCVVGVVLVGPKSSTSMLLITDILQAMPFWGKCFISTILIACLSGAIVYLFRARSTNWDSVKYLVMPMMTVGLTACSCATVKAIGDQLLHLNKLSHDEMVKSLLNLGTALGLLGLFAPGSAYFKIRSTEEFDAKWFFPVCNAGCVTLQMVLGGAIFHEWDRSTTGQMMPFLCLSFLCVMSVLFIDPRDSLKDKIDMKKVVTVAEPAKVDPQPRARGSRDMI